MGPRVTDFLLNEGGVLDNILLCEAVGGGVVPERFCMHVRKDGLKEEVIVVNNYFAV